MQDRTGPTRAAVAPLDEKENVVARDAAAAQERLRAKTLGSVAQTPGRSAATRILSSTPVLRSRAPGTPEPHRQGRARAATPAAAFLAEQSAAARDGLIDPFARAPSSAPADDIEYMPPRTAAVHSIGFQPKRHWMAQRHAGSLRELAALADGSLGGARAPPTAWAWPEDWQVPLDAIAGSFGKAVAQCSASLGEIALEDARADQTPLPFPEPIHIEVV